MTPNGLRTAISHELMPTGGVNADRSCLSAACPPTLSQKCYTQGQAGNIRLSRGLREFFPSVYNVQYYCKDQVGGKYPLCPPVISAVCQGSHHRFVADQNLSARPACPCPVGPVGRRDDDAAARAALMLILLIQQRTAGKRNG